MTPTEIRTTGRLSVQDRVREGIKAILEQVMEEVAGGRSSEDAARSVGVSPAVGARWLRHAGGMPPTHLAPSSAPPSGRYLSFTEREEIALLQAQGHGVREVARRIGRAPSTVSRELRRNAATRGGSFVYRATTAQWHADWAARRPKPAKLATHVRLRGYVQDRLGGAIAALTGEPIAGPVVAWKGRRHGRRQHRRWTRAWSPERRADHGPRPPSAPRLPRRPDDADQSRGHLPGALRRGAGGLRRDLTACLRTGRTLRVPRARVRGRGKSFVAPELLVRHRPAEAADRAIPGHWEGDLRM